MSYLPQIVGFVLLVAASAAAGLIMLGLFLLVSKIAERPIQELEGALSGMRAELREMHMPRWQMAAHVGVMLMVVAVFVAVASAADSAAFGGRGGCRSDSGVPDRAAVRACVARRRREAGLIRDVATLRILGYTPAAYDSCPAAAERRTPPPSFAANGDAAGTRKSCAGSSPTGRQSTERSLPRSRPPQTTSCATAPDRGRPRLRRDARPCRRCRGPCSAAHARFRAACPASSPGPALLPGCDP